MKHRRISAITWRHVRDDWVSCLDPVARVAARHDMGVSTLSRRAKAEGWPPRGSQMDDPATIARRLYIDITAELRASLQALKNDGTEEAAAAANQRTALIRAHRRALIAVLDARKPSAQASKSTAGTTRAEAFPALDLVTAREDVLVRLARLDRMPPP